MIITNPKRGALAIRGRWLILIANCHAVISTPCPKEIINDLDSEKLLTAWKVFHKQKKHSTFFASAAEKQLVW